jgi:hypothetical protein
MGDDDLTHVVSAELQLLDPRVRASPSQVEALLHSEFCEYGASGAVWDRTQILATLSVDPRLTGEARDMRAVHLSRDVILVTYRFDQVASSSLRSSIWVRDAGRWQMRFHQGTPLPAHPGQRYPSDGGSR